MGQPSVYGEPRCKVRALFVASVWLLFPSCGGGGGGGTGATECTSPCPLQRVTFTLDPPLEFRNYSETSIHVTDGDRYDSCRVRRLPSGAERPLCWDDLTGKFDLYTEDEWILDKITWSEALGGEARPLGFTVYFDLELQFEKTFSYEPEPEGAACGKPCFADVEFTVQY